MSWGPARNASFNLGFFTETVIDDKRIPPVTVLMAETGHRQIASAMVAKGMLTGSDMEEQVAADIANSMSFYQIVYGECPVPRLYATEIPDYHGEAFPGLIHLSWITYQSTSHEGEDHAFRAHEVAHQWWGIGVDFATYHDQWLSEGFSEYSALWYTQMALRNNAKFFDLLDRYRDLILSNRHYLFGKGQEAGPIWLGYRTHSSETAGDYDLVVYRKGAWVLHMLRNMMLDLQTMNEDRFKSMMRDFYSSFRGKKAATRDFEVFVSKHMGQDMIWFFRQWVYDTVIPKYTFAYRVEETPEGKYHVQCRVAQEGVSDNFQMPVPLLIKFDGERFARVRVMVTGPQKTIDLGLLPLKPESIEFNDLHSVLCEVDTESWD